MRRSAHLSLFEVDLCALIKRRFVPHGSCVNAIFPRRLFEHTLAVVTYIYVNLTKQRPAVATEYGPRRVVKFTSLISRSNHVLSLWSSE